MLYACAARFDVMKNLKNFANLGTKQGQGFVQLHPKFKNFS